MEGWTPTLQEGPAPAQPVRAALGMPIPARTCPWSSEGQREQCRTSDRLCTEAWGIRSVVSKCPPAKADPYWGRVPPHLGLSSKVQPPKTWRCLWGPLGTPSGRPAAPSGLELVPASAFPCRVIHFRAPVSFPFPDPRPGPPGAIQGTAHLHLSAAWPHPSQQAPGPGPGTSPVQLGSGAGRSPPPQSQGPAVTGLSPSGDGSLSGRSTAASAITL